MVEPIEIAALNLVGQPAAVGGAERALLERSATRLVFWMLAPIVSQSTLARSSQRRSITSASTRPVVDGLQAVVRPWRGRMRTVSCRTRTAHRRLADRQHVVQVSIGASPVLA